MNKGIYRLIWNRSLGALQVVSETATSKPCGGVGGLGSNARRTRCLGALTGLALAMGVAMPGLAAATTYVVTTNASSGPGSFGDALTQANADSGSTVDLSSTPGAIASPSFQTVTAETTLVSTNGFVLASAPLQVIGTRATLQIAELQVSAPSTAANGLNGVNATTIPASGSSPLSGANGSNGTNGASGAAGVTTVVVSGTNAAVTNTGAVLGGMGGNGGFGGAGGNGGSGGAYSGAGNGLSASGGSGGNGGSGGSGGTGGSGVSGTGFTLTNTSTGSISGGTGGEGGSGGNGGSGGTGGSANSAGVTAGNGGTGGNGGAAGHSGTGGTGVSGSNFTLYNDGVINGGSGGFPYVSQGYAGTGGTAGSTASGAVAGNQGNSGSGGGKYSNSSGGTAVSSTGGSTIYNSGTISGGGSFMSNSSGNAIELSGGNNTLVLESTSMVNGSIISAGGDTLTMNNGSVVNGEVHLGGSTLTSGNATVGTLVNDGTVNVGTSLTPILLLNVLNVPVSSPYAQLHVTGDYVQTNAGTLNINALSTSQYSSILVDGDAHLAGTLNVNVAGNSTLVGGNVLSRVISTSGDVIGTFDQVTDNSQLFNFNAVYESDAVDLTAIANSTTGVQDAVEANGNKQAQGAAIALDQAITANPNGALATHFQGLTTSAQVSSAASQTLPLLTSGSMTLANSSLNSINGVVESRSDSIRGISSGDNYMGGEHVWVKPFGSWANQDSRNGSAGYSSSLSGLAFGVDGNFSDRWTLGTALVYGNAESQTKGDVNQRMQTDVYQLVGYGTYHLGNDTDLSFQLDGGRNHNKGSRDIEFADLKAKSSYSTTTAHAGVQLDHTFALNPTTRFIPAIRADYTWIKDDAYSEKGADALDLNANSRSSNQFVLGTNGKLSHDLTDKLTVNGKLGVGYDFLASRDSITTSFAGDPGVAFRTNGTSAAPWIVGGSTSLDYQLNTATKVSLRYDAEHRSGFQNQTASAEVRWAF